MADQKPTVQNPAAASPPAGPFAGVVGTVIGGVLGMLLLVLVVSLLERPPQGGEHQELPHAVIVVEFSGDLSQALARKQTADLQRGLVATGLAVQGLLDYPILVPGDRPGDMPTPKRLDEITDAEWAQAWPYLASGGWIIPKLLSSDAKRVVFRLAPPGRGIFPPGSRDQLDKVLADMRPVAKVWIYSRALGLEDEEARSVINASFGVQTAHVTLRSDSGNLTRASTHAKVHQIVGKLTTTRIRSATTMGNFAVYLASARSHEKSPDMAIVDLPAALALAKELKMPNSVFDGGKRAVMEVMTDAEGEANLDVGYRVVSHLDVSKTDGVYGEMERKRRQ